jgi:hypothetical protein
VDTLGGPQAVRAVNEPDGSITVRVMDRDGESWFVASDVCGVLDVGNVGQALARLEEDEKTIISIDTPGGAQGVLAVSEPGMYSLIMTSRKPPRFVEGKNLPSSPPALESRIGAPANLRPVRSEQRLCQPPGS